MAARITNPEAAPVSRELSSKELTHRMNVEMDKAKARKQELYQIYKNEKKVPVQISPFYAPYFSKNQPVSINGISIYVPSDGKTYQVPKPFADVINRRIQRIDALIQKQGAMSSFIEERYAGEAELITAE
jgi:hypothetical protein